MNATNEGMNLPDRGIDHIGIGNSGPLNMSLPLVVMPVTVSVAMPPWIAGSTFSGLFP